MTVIRYKGYIVTRVPFKPYNSFNHLTGKALHLISLIVKGY